MNYQQCQECERNAALFLSKLQYWNVLCPKCGIMLHSSVRYSVFGLGNLLYECSFCVQNIIVVNSCDTVEEAAVLIVQNNAGFCEGSAGIALMHQHSCSYSNIRKCCNSIPKVPALANLLAVQ